MKKEYVTTPPGRIVQGSLYEPQTKNAMGLQLFNKSGAPRENYYVGLAIPKSGENSWSKTEWGQKILEAAQSVWPSGEWNTPKFAWKITDGDSGEPNSKGVAPVEKEGYAGHWVLNLTNGFAPAIYNANGTSQITTPGHINAGDYIQACCSIVSNGSPQTFPGIFINILMVAFVGFGEPIVFVDPKAAGFGAYPIPSGASPTPKSRGFNPQSFGPTTPMLPPLHTTPTAIPQPAPYPGVLQVPIPPPRQIPDKKMTAAANGVSYEAHIAQGWTDALLIQHGYLLP